ncbi:MAG: hypothetical protein K6G27_08845 [Lachnospiraceae bacterium]|nr:hypothetical protein [Lachnospiraceae bacterium]
MKKGLTEIVFILDRSGSMSGLESDTIGGYNSMLKKQKGEDGEAIISTVLFDDQVEILHDRKDIARVRPITNKDYYVRGCTALLDAVGGAIKHIGKVQKEAGDDRPEKTLFIITTDGMENASRKYTYDKLKKMVEKKKEKNHWEFIFMGANIDAISVAGRFGVAANRAVRFENDGMGAELNFNVMSKLVSCARAAKSAEAVEEMIDEECMLDNIREDYEEYEELSKKDTKWAEADEDVIKDIHEKYDRLVDRERDVIMKLYGIDGEKRHSYDDLAADYNLTAGRIRQIEKRALRKMGK